MELRIWPGPFVGGRESVMLGTAHGVRLRGQAQPMGYAVIPPHAAGASVAVIQRGGKSGEWKGTGAGLGASEACILALPRKDL
ncbi:MAG: hypothetical protein KBF43_07320 [Dermatophilaceae bacterium]|nr:hypothetical protein [Dermatophilaceae bacterium]